MFCKNTSNDIFVLLKYKKKSKKLLPSSETICRNARRPWETHSWIGLPPHLKMWTNVHPRAVAGFSGFRNHDKTRVKVITKTIVVYLLPNDFQPIVSKRLSDKVFFPRQLLLPGLKEKWELHETELILKNYFYLFFYFTFFRSPSGLESLWMELKLHQLYPSLVSSRSQQKQRDNSYINQSWYI